MRYRIKRDEVLLGGWALWCGRSKVSTFRHRIDAECLCTLLNMGLDLELIGQLLLIDEEGDVA